MENDKLEKLINNFNNLDKKEQKKITNHINSVWFKAHTEYVEMCSQDEELCEAYDYLKKAKEIMSFDLKDYYFIHIDTINEFDPENAEYIYEFDPKALEEAKHVYEHLEEVNAPLQEKLEKLNKQLADVKAELDKVEKRGGMFKRIQIAALKSRMNELESEITSVQVDIKRNVSKAEHYQYCMQQQAEKERYIQNYSTLVEPYKKLYEERTKIYADKVMEKYLESDPIIICKEQTSRITSSDTRAFASEPLNKACNAKRYEVLFAMKDKGVEKV